VLNDLLQADYDVPLKINYNQRRKLLDLLLKFYAEHMQHLGEIKSVQVLRELFM
jgi:hypothetical protein